MSKKKPVKTAVKLDQTEIAVEINNNLFFYDLVAHQKMKLDVEKVMLVVGNKKAEIGICYDKSINKIEFNYYTNGKNESTKSVFSFDQIIRLIKSSEIHVD